MKFRSLPLPFITAAMMFAVACYAPTSAATKYDCLNPGTTGQADSTIADTAGIFSLNGGPPNGPSGVNTCKPSPVIVQPASHFDFAVNIDGTQAYVLTPLLVSSAGLGAGWLSVTANYDTLSDAPTFGYNDSLALAIAPGSVFMIQAATIGCQGLPYQSQHYVYSKYIIDSINYTPYNAVTAPNGLTVYYRMVTDPVCGYTSLAPGIPPH